MILLPSRRAILLTLVLLLLALPAALDGLWQQLWWIALALLAAVLLLDGIGAFLASPPVARRRVAGSLPLGVRSKVELRLHNPAGKPLRLSIYDHHPAEMQAEGLPAQLTVQPTGWTRLRYSVLPAERGEFLFPCIQLRQGSPFGLWWRNRKLELEQRVRVYPNFAAVAKYALLANADRTPQMGIRKRRRRGQGSELHQLREFRQGDGLRQVDWLATARHQKLISREYQHEREQNIILLLDCGRNMRARDAELSHFDHALNAMLLLTYVALRQGDAVGVATFSGAARWLKPVRGQGMQTQVLNTVYDLQPGTDAPDYSQAALQLLQRQRKHALVVVLTGLRDEAESDLQSALNLLRRRHSVLLASLREQAMDQLQGQQIDRFDQALTLTATQQYLRERQRAIQRLRAAGINCLDVTPAQLSVSLVNQYLAMKALG